MVKEIHDLKQLESNGLALDEMIEKLQGSDGEILKYNITNYEPKIEIVNKLAEKANGYTIVVFSADWCKDCKTNVAAFAKILQVNSDIKAIFLGYYFKWYVENSLDVALKHGFRIRKEGAKMGLYNYADIDDDLMSVHHYFKWYKFGFTCFCS